MSKVLRRAPRIGREGSEEHWIPLSDLMTSLMFLFLLIALAYMVQVQQQSAQTVRLVEAYRLRRDALFDDLERQFRPDLRRWDADLTSDLTIHFHNPDILFAPGSSTLRPSFQQALREFFPRYLGILTSGKYRDVIKELRIEGSAPIDARRATSSQQAYLARVELSQNRALSVLAYVAPLVRTPAERAWLGEHVSADGPASSSRLTTANGKPARALSQGVDFRLMDTVWERVGQSLDAQRDAVPPALPLSSVPFAQRRDASRGPYSVDAVVAPNADPVYINLDRYAVVGVDAQQPISIIGWATNHTLTKPASAVFARVDSSRLITAKYGSIRDDVAQALHDPALNHVGFTIDIPAKSLSPGEHHFDIIIMNSAGKRDFVARNRFTLNVH